ncbi:divalent-cation tolerance protein CutA [Hyphobacterium marinum]|uniref:Divalent-cation tolerance protein CutA n=1 Tax=Hyphobacterium marinum TaxID=3116574 RepID=A0ABU7LXC4_9PROT|nr:divalent-cation tolerance protein CutA [Hyphobacterium sp. Y6023]MEE2566169.1 divalent-cation tolerance protein CutA [Hyphobacterium sp. Y6023]
MAELQLIYTTWPDAALAENAAHTLLEERLIACANIFPAGRSVFRWEGEVQAEAETVMILKTGAGRASAVRDRVSALHPYDTPAIVGIPALDGATCANFAAWVVAETRG